MAYNHVSCQCSETDCVGESSGSTMTASICEYLGHRRTHLRRVKADGDDRIRAEALRMVAESLQGQVAHLFEKIGIHLDLAAAPGGKKAKMFCPSPRDRTIKPKVVPMTRVTRYLRQTA